MAAETEVVAAVDSVDKKMRETLRQLAGELRIAITKVLEDPCGPTGPTVRRFCGGEISLRGAYESVADQERRQGLPQGSLVSSFNEATEREALMRLPGSGTRGLDF